MTSATTTKAYRVETFQEGDWWVARVAGLDANYTRPGHSRKCGRWRGTSSPLH